MDASNSIAELPGRIIVADKNVTRSLKFLRPRNIYNKITIIVYLLL